MSVDVVYAPGDLVIGPVYTRALPIYTFVKQFVADDGDVRYLIRAKSDDQGIIVQRKDISPPIARDELVPFGEYLVFVEKGECHKLLTAVSPKAADYIATILNRHGARGLLADLAKSSREVSGLDI